MEDINIASRQAVAAGDKSRLEERLSGKPRIQKIVSKVFGSIEYQKRIRNRKAIVVGGLDPSLPKVSHTCQRTAKRVYELLGQQYQCVLIDEEAVKSASTGTGSEKFCTLLDQAIDTLFMHASSEDTLLLYYSGHGALNNDKEHELRLCGADDAYPMRALLDLARRIKYRSFVIILDCCFSGSVGDDPMRGTFRQIPQNMCIITANKPGQEVCAIASMSQSETGLGQKHWELNESLTDSRMTDDKTAASTARPTVKSYRAIREEMCYTYFSHYIIEAICGGAANPLGIVTLSSVYQYVSEALGANFSSSEPGVTATRPRPMMKGYLVNEVPICYVEGILREVDLENLIKFRNSLYDRSKRIDLPKGASRADYDAKVLELRKMPVEFIAGQENSLRRLILLGLITPMGQNYKKGNLVDVYKLTPRGWHYWELIQQVSPEESSQPSVPSFIPTDLQSILDQVYKLIEPFVSKQ